MNMRVVFALTAVGFMLLFLTPTLEGCRPKCPAMSITKFFYYTELDSRLFGEDSKNWPVRGLDVGVTFGKYHGEFNTGADGFVRLNGVPSGDYVFNWTWNGIPKTESLPICCAQKDWVFKNFVDAKGHT